jgi:MATE family multidrug resistance protein
MAARRAKLVEWWSRAAGGREVLAVSYPLILSQISFTAQTFVDRVLLTWYSPEAVAGAMAGGISTLAVVHLFVGTGEYLTTFVAQYFGARRDQRIGPAIWQGVYFALGAGLLVASLVPIAGPFFAAAGHPPAVREAETTYAGVLMTGAFAPILMATLASFFAGRGSNHVVLLVNIVATAVNCVFDYLWIFGHGGFPSWGVAGAAWATVLSQVVGALIYLGVILGRAHRERFRTLAGWRLDLPLLGRLLRYGFPSGLQTSLEILAFAFFLIIVGRVGTLPLAASAIAFGLNTIVFFPMYGLGIGVSSLVGRYLGAERPELAERSTWSGFWMSLVYMAFCGAFYVGAPRLLLLPFAAGADPNSFPEVAAISVVLLRFVAVYSIFDMMNVVFAAGLKGAGDTTYPLMLTIVLSWGAMLGPGYVACILFGAGVYVAWLTASVYIVLLGLLMIRRFRAGGWKSLRVIEPHVPEMDAAVEGEPA